MKRSALPIATWVLLGLLVVAAVTFSLGKGDVAASLSASSFSPSGTRAFADLLGAQGYKVDVTTTPNPRLRPNDVLVAFVASDRTGTFAPQEPFQNGTKLTIDDHVKNGGSAVVLSVRYNFLDASKAGIDSVQKVSNIWNAGATVNWDEAPIIEPQEASSGQDITEAAIPETGKELTIAQTQDGTPLASLRNDGSGHYLTVTDGIIATNRFLDKHDNASEAVRLVRTIAPEGSRLVFLDASSGNGSPPTIVGTLGPWAVAGLWQIILLFLVVIYTLGKPFGYPDEERRTQRGARDLVDAVAQTYRRARATPIALSAALTDADHELRRKLKLPFSTPRADRDRLLPADLSRALANIEVASQDRIPPSEAVSLVQRLNRQMREFLGEQRVHARKRKH